MLCCAVWSVRETACASLSSFFFAAFLSTALKLVVVIRPTKKRNSRPGASIVGLCVFSLAFVSADEIAGVRDQGLLKPKAKRV